MAILKPVSRGRSLHGACLPAPANRVAVKISGRVAIGKWRGQPANGHAALHGRKRCCRKRRLACRLIARAAKGKFVAGVVVHVVASGANHGAATIYTYYMAGVGRRVAVKNVSGKLGPAVGIMKDSAALIACAVVVESAALNGEGTVTLSEHCTSAVGRAVRCAVPAKDAGLQGQVTGGFVYGATVACFSIGKVYAANGYGAGRSVGLHNSVSVASRNGNAVSLNGEAFGNLYR